ncbi:hypothetical protein [Nocardia cyriacigeorgica]|uniref:hypothetical protein n=1 Tax=Nocardia cyriacigeorgica TaxID=135487 RepID=UPI001485D6EA|nr:hypothetical protein [Nocardia cyriacigeorgica]
MNDDTRPQMIQQEPSATARQFARGVRDMYNALTQEGFTEPQVLHIIGVMLANAGGDNK